MLVKTKSIVLHTLKYGDTSLIVHLYTEKQGRLAILVKGVTGKKAVFKPAYFRPLNILDTELYYIPGRNLQRIKEVRFYYPYQSVPFNIRKSTVALFLSEVLRKTLTEEEKNPALFSWLSTSLQIFDQLDHDFSDFHLAFLIRLCRYLGFDPQNNYSLQNSFFDLREGMFVSSPPPHPDSMEEPLAQTFYDYLSTPLGEKMKTPVNRQNTGKLLTTVLDYYNIHLEGMGEIKSLPVLKEVFHNSPES